MKRVHMSAESGAMCIYNSLSFIGDDLVEELYEISETTDTALTELDQNTEKKNLQNAIQRTEQKRGKYRKIRNLFLFPVFAAAFVGIVCLIAYISVKDRYLSEEQIAQLRIEYPVVRGSGTACMVPPGSLEQLVENAQMYICVTVPDPGLQTETAPRDTAQNTYGTMKPENSLNSAGESAGYSAKWWWKKVVVDSVIFGEDCEENTEITITINQRLPMPVMNPGQKLILPVAKRADGWYDLMVYGAYYVVDGYVISAFDEAKDSVYSGIPQEELIEIIKAMK